MVDRATILLCLDSSPKGQEALYNNTIRYTYAIVKRYIENQEEQKDIIQEAYAKVFLNIKKYDESKGPFKAWLRKITVNECLMFLRKHKNTLKHQTLEINDSILMAENEPSNSLTRNDILQLLNKMPQRYKLVFMLNVIDDYNHKEIGEILGIEESTSRSQLLRAKKWIEKNLSLSSNNQ